VNLVIKFSYSFLGRNASAFKKNLLLMLAGELRENGIIMIKQGSELEQYLKKIEEISPAFVTPAAPGTLHVNYSVEYE
jgi:hypothetical protein